MLVTIPLGVVTDTFPEAVPVGTTADILVEELTLNEVAATPPNDTAVAPINAVPVICTVVPGHP